LHDLWTPVGKDAEYLFQELAHAGVSPVDRAFSLHHVNYADDVRMLFLHECLYVVPSHGVVGAVDGLHVLLRHRASIPNATLQAGCLERFLSALELVKGHDLHVLAQRPDLKEALRDLASRPRVVTTHVDRRHDARARIYELFE